MNDELTPRERRAQRAKTTKKKVQMDYAKFKKLVVPAVIILVASAIAWQVMTHDDKLGDCPGHWHAAYTVYVEGDRVAFNHGSFEDASNSAAPGTHIHGDDGIYHFHPALQRCTTWREALRNLDVQVGKDSLTLGDKLGGHEGRYEANATLELKVYQQKWSDKDPEWREVTSFGKVLDKQPKNGDGVVIILGAHSDEEIDVLLSQARSIRGNGAYDPYIGE